MPDLSELADTALEASATRPLNATIDGNSAADHSIPDKIALKKFADEQADGAAMNAQGGRRSGWAGLRPAQAILPGGV